MAYRDEEWRDEARCFNINDPEIFFPVRDKDTYKDVALEAKAVCFGPEENHHVQSVRNAYGMQ